jgi:hypothetical protein
MLAMLAITLRESTSLMTVTYALSEVCVMQIVELLEHQSRQGEQRAKCVRQGYLAGQNKLTIAGGKRIEVQVTASSLSQVVSMW